MSVGAVMLTCMTTLAPSVLQPSFWLVAGLAWPDDQPSVAESAVAVAPDAFQVQLLSTPTRQVFDVARYFASHGQHRVVFLAELTRWLDHFGHTWASHGIDFDQALYDITEVLPGIYLALDRRSYCIVCDASREGMVIHYPDGREQLTEADRNTTRLALTQTITEGWPAYIQSLQAD
ncbi:hypothetical protein B1T45_07720 [Mycobacterium kansasii]|nr:hypothetical protein MKAN_21420 [Mycobacterium kansasii ATCC 12478]ARG55762.1 hypothetical protein B1T43_07645 [Mycobacterium kansasii]ARG61205.1 hypothetical protein B1T45_07720 [Mycobacterium kansasii]ARG68910.1 hypothetical protein B1T47_07490 [Mycobacterium kansasii]ARG76458.1 hypothetical protein B1T51_20540 [Mycobacterium kansasii]